MFVHLKTTLLHGNERFFEKTFPDFLTTFKGLPLLSQHKFSYKNSLPPVKRLKDAITYNLFTQFHVKKEQRKKYSISMWKSLKYNWRKQVFSYVSESKVTLQFSNQPNLDLWCWITNIFFYHWTNYNFPKNCTKVFLR